MEKGKNNFSLEKGNNNGIQKTVTDKPFQFILQIWKHKLNKFFPAFLLLSHQRVSWLHYNINFMFRNPLHKNCYKIIKYILPPPPPQSLFSNLHNFAVTL